MGMPKQPKDARAHWDETGKFDKYFSANPGEGRLSRWILEDTQMTAHGTKRTMGHVVVTSASDPGCVKTPHVM
jgi:hypothetical protein